MKTVNFHPEAEAEMIAAAVYYEEQQATGLGRKGSRICSGLLRQSGADCACAL